MELNILIYSKDRACQLDLCLRTLEEKLKVAYKVQVQYTCSSGVYERGYEKLRGEYANVTFVKEWNL